MPPAVPFVRNLYPPSHPKGAVGKGVDVVGVKRPISRAGYFPWNDFDNFYNEAIGKAVKAFQKAKGLPATGVYDLQTHNKLVATHREGAPKEWAFDDVSINLMKEAKKAKHPPLPPLGPVSPGGKSVLDHDLTHKTDGVSLYPAFDDVFGGGRTVIAPEPLVITEASSSDPGDACYADGASGLRYWIGHFSVAPAVGRQFKKGEKLGVTSSINKGGGPHSHWGVNVEKLWGRNKQFLHHTNYTHGAPTIGWQLAKAST